MGCGTDVVWSAGRWRNVGQRSGRHVCPPTRERCGAFMPMHRDRCARKPGHGYEHRSEYALENARRRWVA